MDIKSLTTLKLNQNPDTNGDILYDLFIPQMMDVGQNVQEHIVSDYEEMRLDNIMMSVYEDDIYLEHMDIILFINNIDNPLNIKRGDKLYFPKKENLDYYRISEDISSNDSIIKDKLSIPNKTMKVDNNRKEYKRKEIKNNEYTLPPVVLDSPKDSVRTEDGYIIMGGVG